MDDINLVFDQSLTTIDTNDANDISDTICELCHTADHNKMVSLDMCKHKYHICCLIDHIVDKNLSSIRCPKCGISIIDIRLSIAVSFKRNNIQELIQSLTSY